MNIISNWRRKASGLFLFSILFAIASLLILPNTALANGVEVRTIPAHLLPFEAESHLPVKLTEITIETKNLSNSQQQPNKQMRVTIQLPRETPWLSTDFPMVEGKTLLSVSTILPTSGTWSINTVLPIRGNYWLSADLIDGEHLIESEQKTLHVDENPSKYLYFVALATLLFLVGLGGAQVIGGKQLMAPGQLAPTRVELLLSVSAIAALIAMLILAVAAEMNTHQSCHSKAGLSCQSNGQSLEKSSSITSDTAHTLALVGNSEATVGESASYHLQVIDLKTNKPALAAPVTIDVTQCEENFPVLSFTGLTDDEGMLAWKETFFDGAPHKIEACLAKNSLKAWQYVSVEPIHPPLARRLIGFFYMVVFLLIGLLCGLLYKKRRG
jgi:hypothetical protein